MDSYISKFQSCMPTVFVLPGAVDIPEHRFMVGGEVSVQIASPKVMQYRERMGSYQTLVLDLYKYRSGEEADLCRYVEVAHRLIRIFELLKSYYLDDLSMSQRAQVDSEFKFQLIEKTLFEELARAIEPIYYHSYSQIGLDDYECRKKYKKSRLAVRNFIDMQVLGLYKRLQSTFSKKCNDLASQFHIKLLNDLRPSISGPSITNLRGTIATRRGSKVPALDLRNTTKSSEDDELPEFE